MDMAQQPAVEWGRVQFGGGDRCIDAGGLVPVRVEQAEVGAGPGRECMALQWATGNLALGKDQP